MILVWYLVGSYLCYRLTSEGDGWLCHITGGYTLWLIYDCDGQCAVWKGCVIVKVFKFFKPQYTSYVQLPCVWIAIGMVSMWPLVHISTLFIQLGYMLGMLCVAVVVLVKFKNLFLLSYRYPLALLYGDIKEAPPRVYTYELNQATLPSDFKYDVYMSTIGFVVLFYISIAYEVPVFASIIIYLSLYPAMHMFRMVRCMRRRKLKATCAWKIYGYHIWWVLPSLELFSLPDGANVYLVCCSIDDTQSTLSYAISDRSASLYLVYDKTVIPVCYNPNDNQAAINQLTQMLTPRDLPVIQLSDNHMPRTVSTRKLTQYILAFWVGLLVIFIALYHIAGGDMQTILLVSPVMSFVGVWAGLELYSCRLRKYGFTQIRIAAGL